MRSQKLQYILITASFQLISINRSSCKTQQQQEISSFAVVGRLTSGLLFLRSLSQRSASQNLRIKIGKINSGEQTSCRCDYFLQGPLVFSVTLCKTVIAKRERLILMVESTAASGVLHIFGQEVSYNFGHSPLRPP
ncbi:hypothetical protein Bca52824_039236 [Brassica carinata]|uniref:Uncharacterized protein n=1 Tax=Brassica carinata TaxID=52824 RepID=A0A8X7RR55_BRACI|nr:hypothetical protein Bca52824_039236 [Brassica carinata]